MHCHTNNPIGMSEKSLEIYSHYKQMLSEPQNGSLLFFRIGNNYEVYHDDAFKLAALAHIECKEGCIAFPADDLLEMMFLLSDNGVGVKIIQCVSISSSSSGEFVFPNDNVSYI